MPQLDPTPWFFILVTSWFIFITMTTAKVSKYHHLNNPSPQAFKGLSKPWTWPWP
uniref:ATP synthase complex subunit 8 n=1 Tax=Leptodactylus fallax TaxID=375434 RepID=A0A7T3RB24_LEPFX|nr:ATP synthase F0 subunit 8 [Leptodactylus fallax]QPZ94304.1 ATP synthase F0 subunit 8 [Leptodactylus fallax]